MNISIWAICKAEQISDSSIVVLFGTTSKSGKDRIKEVEFEDGSGNYVEIFGKIPVIEAVKVVESETINVQLTLDPDSDWKIVKMKKWNVVKQNKIPLIFSGSALDKIAAYKMGIPVNLQQKTYYCTDKPVYQPVYNSNRTVRSELDLFIHRHHIDFRENKNRVIYEWILQNKSDVVEFIEILRMVEQVESNIYDMSIFNDFYNVPSEKIYGLYRII